MPRSVNFFDPVQLNPDTHEFRIEYKWTLVMKETVEESEQPLLFGRSEITAKPGEQVVFFAPEVITIT